MAQVVHTLEVNLHDLHLPLLADEELRHHTHAWSYFQYGQVWAGIYGIGNPAGYTHVCQKVLPKELFRPYCAIFHN